MGHLKRKIYKSLIIGCDGGAASGKTTGAKLIAKKYNLYLIEDSCEALGAKYKNKKVGSIGDLATFSFFASHHITTMEGGMLVTNNSKFYEIGKSLRAHGWTRNLGIDNPLHKKSNNKFIESFNVILPGYN